MDQKMMKIITIILGVLLVIALFLVVSYATNFSSLESRYKQLEGLNQGLSSDKNNLTAQVSGLKAEADKLREYKSNYERASQELDKANSVRDDLQKRIDALIKDRTELSEKLEKALIEKAASDAAVKARQEPKEATFAAAPPADEYWAGVLKDKTNLEIEVANLKDVIKNTQIKSEEYLKDKTSLEIDLERATKEKEDLQNSLKYNEKTGDSLSMQLYQEKEDKRRLKTQVDLLKEENYDLRGRLKEVMNNKVAIEKKLKIVEEKRQELYSRLNQMDGVLQDKLSSIYDTKSALTEIKKSSSEGNSSIELSPIVVRPQSMDVKNVSSLEAEPVVIPGASSEMNALASGGNSGTNTAGKIVNVDTENNFVIVSLGDSQGIAKGMSLGVFRGNEQIGVLEVIEVRTRSCAADIKEKSASFKVGDIVR